MRIETKTILRIAKLSGVGLSIFKCTTLYQCSASGVIVTIQGSKQNKFLG